MIGELNKIELKRELYVTGEFQLSNDSFMGTVINPEFQAIDKGLNREVYAALEVERQRENILISDLMSGNKISLGF